MKRIVYTDGGEVRIVVPANGAPLEAVIKRAVPADTPYQIVEHTDLPADRLFRNAWSHDGAKVTEDMGKSKALAHDARRRKRDEEFAPLDAEIAKAIPGRDTTALEAQRQAIRDKYAAMQSDIDAGVTVDDLRPIMRGLV